MKSDTRKLLINGCCIFGVGVVGALLALTVFGGIGPQGPHSNGGWLMLMLAMGCLPLGLLTLLLALSKCRATAGKSGRKAEGAAISEGGNLLCSPLKLTAARNGVLSHGKRRKQGFSFRQCR